MSFTYAIADLHGRADLLLGALEGIFRHANGRPGTIVTLGDYVDRGPSSKVIIENLMAGLQDKEWKLVTLKGNHEEIMWTACRRPSHMGWWMQNGGGMTLISYGQKDGDKADPTVVPEAHLKWIEELPLMHFDEHRVYVHAGVRNGVPLTMQQFETEGHGGLTLLWKLYADADEGGHGYRHVVHGHHQFENGPVVKKGRTDLDTNAWRTGRLVVGIFDDEVPGGAVDFLEVTGAPAFAPRPAEPTAS